MRWIPVLIMVLIILVVQVGMVPPLGLGPQRIVPDLLLMLAVALAFRGEKDQSLLVCWLLGLLKDLTGQAPLGCNALAFGLTAVFIVSLRDYLYGNRPLILMGLTLMLAFLTQVFELWIILYKKDAVVQSFEPALLTILFSAMFTAALAPYMSWLVSSFHSQLGLPGRRR